MAKLFNTNYPQYHYLKNKWVNQHRAIQKKLWETHQEVLNWLPTNVPLRQIAVGSLQGLMVLSTPVGLALSSPQHIIVSDQVLSEQSENAIIAEKLVPLVPKEVRPLTTDEENNITQALESSFGFSVKGKIDGIRLNRSYGLIGGEQHLYRYPGDSLFKHADSASDWAMYGDAGIAPHLGAWGYFVSSEKELTEKDKAREKYYLAVQTFLAPGFAENVAKYRDFFKYRKMLVVNPVTGGAVVADIADAGPAEFTGKHLGGSPEVMHSLGLSEGPRKGAVLYFFIDDPNDNITLGPKVKN